MIKQLSTYYPDYSLKSFTEYLNDSIIIYKEYNKNGDIIYFNDNDSEYYFNPNLNCSFELYKNGSWDFRQFDTTGRKGYSFKATFELYSSGDFIEYIGYHLFYSYKGKIKPCQHLCTSLLNLSKSINPIIP